MARTEVPINPEVLRWAIFEGGFTPADVADHLSLAIETVDAWIDGLAQPSMTEFRSLLRLLKRPFATFFLPEPPSTPTVDIKFRHPVEADRRTLTTHELNTIRGARRVQEVSSWILSQIDAPAVAIPEFSIGSAPSTAAEFVRSRMFNSAQPFESASQAQAWWRGELERLGMLVFFLPLGEDSCRGFSIWDQYAPLIVVNTWWKIEARIFSMLHELGHLITRSNSACLEQGYSHRRRPIDAAERWCESFAARVLIPETACRTYLKEQLGWNERETIRDVEIARLVAQNFKVSIAAAAIRLIELGAADWSLFRLIKRNTDFKKRGGGGKGERTPEIRVREYGEKTIQILSRAVSEDILDRDQALDYLRVSDSDFKEMAG